MTRPPTLVDGASLPGAPERRSERHEEVERWRATRSNVMAPGDEAALERQLSRGKLLARERIEQLLDPGSFQELDMLTRTADAELLRGRRAYGDGVVAGWGSIAGRRTFVFAQDPTVIGGSLGETGGAKVHKLLDLAIDAGAPVVGISDGGGARIQEGVASLNAFGGIFFRNTRASGVVPQISLIMGTATGGAVYSPALTDFVFMVEGTSAMAITGPRVVKQVTGEDISLEGLGGASVHAEGSGVVHFAVPDEQTCLDTARLLLGFLPQNNRQRPPATPSRPPHTDNGGDPLDALPGTAGAPYDIRNVVTALVDAGDILEYARRWAPNVVCSFARLDGHPVGIVANQPGVHGGRLDIDGCEKAARFVRTCDAFNVPVVTIVDCPGFVPGVEQEHGGIVRASAKLVYAYAEATSPQVHLVVGRAYGEAIVAMGATRSLSGMCLAWPTADLAASPSNRRAGVPAGLRGGPYEAALDGTIDQVVEPHETRATLIETLAMLGAIERPWLPRKHENLPL